jgi:arabinose-5-phosphate isomerase
MSASPKTLTSEAMAVEAKELLEENNISQVLIEDNNEFSGVVHIHDLVKEGII